MDSPGQIRLQDCWAKTYPAGHPREGEPALTVRDHCLIVGAVAEVALRCLPSSCLRLPPPGAATLTAAHDIGKITPGFLRKCAKSLFHRINGAQSCEPNHAKVSQAFLASLAELQDARGNPLNWTLAADGHHGRYWLPRAAKTFNLRYGPRVSEGPFPWPDALRKQLMNDLIACFGELPREEIETGARLHWLTGFVTFCDWIGSNLNWFPLPDSPSLQDHADLESSKKQSEQALAEILWHHREVRAELDFPDLFALPGFTPRPLQSELIRHCDRPGLYIVEAPMGMGKTEAALAAAYRRWTEGGERGLYFALPTQLTSNRIHERVGGFLENVIAGQSVRALAHGNAWLREDRIQAFQPAVTVTSDQKALPDANDACHWFASSRRALLAPFGTGTIDQALMARIAAKHSALRLFALSGKVVIIDEVHSYDPYTAKLVDHLTAWLLETGCTVIILSATLTARRRAQLVAAAGGTEPSPPPDAYPLITRVSTGKTTHLPIEDPATHESTVKLRHLTDPGPDLWQEIADAARKGACVLVIRNTVASAQETWRQLKSAACGDDLKIGLLHSRFPHFRREENESEWMQLLGKDHSQRPHGCILVATQVVEQSVDIDADLLVTDTAPTDLLLQRLGRLHRHPRSRPAGFTHPECWILHQTVDWSVTPKEIKDVLGPVAHVYPPFSLYQTERVWRGLDTIHLPREIRPLLEKSDAIPENMPAGASALRDELEKLVQDMLQAGSRQDPFHQSALEDTEGTQTRWNPQPSALLVLLREPPKQQGHRITVSPLHGPPVTFTSGIFSYDLAKALHENAARTPAYLIRDAAHRQQQALPWLGQHADGAVIATCSDDTAVLEMPDAGQNAYQLSYSTESGIHHERIATADKYTLAEDFDSWF